MAPLLSACKIIGLLLSIGLGTLCLFLWIGWPKIYPKTYGITWSATYARYLGVDPTEGLTKALEELHVRYVRLPVYWSEVEPEEGQFVWQEIDDQLALIQKHEGKAILVLGAKQPRWPECHYPAWVKEQSSSLRGERQLAYVEAAVRRYRTHPAVEMWQVENEPGFFSWFGDCSFFDKKLIPEEASLVARLDREGATTSRKIITTASGELSRWVTPSNTYTGLGISVYRVTANLLTKRWSYWFLPPWFYAHKANLFYLGRTKNIFVSEFQMEPWVQTDMKTMPISEQWHYFDLTQMKKNRLFAERMDMPRVYFWGAEWWYWMKIQNYPHFWEEARTWFSPPTK